MSVTAEPTTEELLAGLRRLEGVTAVWLLDQSGAVQHAVPGGEESELQGEVTGALTGAVRQAVSHLKLSALREVMIETADGALLVSVGPEAGVIVLLIRARANVGLLRLEARKTRSRLTGSGGEPKPSQ